MPQFWITIAIDATDPPRPRSWRTRCHPLSRCRVIQVVDEPPQGAMVVGNLNED